MNDAVDELKKKLNELESEFKSTMTEINTELEGIKESMVRNDTNLELNQYKLQNVATYSTNQNGSITDVSNDWYGTIQHVD